MRSLSLLVLAAAAFGAVGFAISREVPVGGVKGRVTMKENGRPLVRTRIALYAKDSDSGLLLRAITDAEGRFVIKNVPAGNYTVEVSSLAHTAEDRVLTIKEGDLTEIDVAAKPTEPYLDLTLSQHTYLPGESVEVLLHGFNAEDKPVNYRLYEMDPDKVANRGGFAETLYGLSRQTDGDLAQFGKKIDDKPVAQLKRDAEGIFTQQVKFETPKEGFYVSEFVSGNVRKLQYFFVSKIGLITKDSSNRFLVYCADLRTGQPEQGVRVNVVGGAAQASNEDGFVELPTEHLPTQMVIRATKGDSTILVPFRRPSEKSTRDTKVAVYTDRPIYRPGDTVLFKGIARKAVGKDLLPCATGDQLNVEVTMDSERFYQTSAVVNEHGSFEFSVPTKNYWLPRYYEVNIKGAQLSTNSSFELLEYKKPIFSVKVEPSAKRLLIGDKLEAKVSAEYYDGGGVAGAKFHAMLTRTPVNFSWMDEEMGRQTSGGDVVSELDGVLDDNGQFSLNLPTLPTDPAANNAEDLRRFDYEYILDVSVNESESRSENGTASIDVTRGDLELMVDQDRYFGEPGQMVHFEVRSTKVGEPDVPQTPSELLAKVYHVKWESRNQKKELIDTVKLPTNEKGKAELILNVPDVRVGEVLVEFLAKDDRGRSITAEGNLWVGPKGYGYEVQGGRAEPTLILDKKAYGTGEKAVAMIGYPVEGASVWLTVESDEILLSKLVKVKNGAAKVVIPTLPDHYPNATVSVCAIAEKNFSQATREIKVDNPSKLIKVKVETDKSNYLPGQEATVKVSTVNAAGQPVPAEVSVGTVDEAIYAIREDNVNLKDEFYPMRYSSVSTTYSFPEVYLDNGDKAGANLKNIALRKDFRDTAGWLPQVWTGPEGKAEVKVKLPDNLTTWRISARAVTDDTKVGQVVEKFVTSKPLSVRLLGPNFLTRGDQVSFKVALKGEKLAGKDVEYSILSKGLELEKAGRVTLDNAGLGYAEIEAAPKSSGEYKIEVRASAENGATTDGIELPITVASDNPLSVSNVSGFSNQSFTHEPKFGPNVDRGEGELVVTLSPTLIGGMLDSLEGNLGFPYGCAEQTMSRMMPSVVLADVIRKMGGDASSIDGRLDEILAKGGLRLKQIQRSEGNFGWWEHSEPDPFMTAYVLDGVSVIESLGKRVPLIQQDKIVEGAIPMLKNYQREEGLYWSRSEYLYLARVLARYEPARAEVQSFLKRLDRDKMSAADLAQLALIERAVGARDKGQGTYRQLLRKLGPLGQPDWMGQSEWYFGSESAAISLQAVQAFEPNRPELAQMAMLLVRKRDRWQSTRDTAQCLLAVAPIMAANQELKAGGSASVLLNGKAIKTVSYEDVRAGLGSEAVHIPISELGDRPKIEVKAEGRAGVYYSIELRQHAELSPTTSPAKIERSYHRLRLVKNEDGTSRYVPETEPVTDAKIGEILICRLKVKVKDYLRYGLIEDPIPSNCKVVTDENQGLASWDTETFLPWNLSVRDRKVVLFPDWIKDELELTYRLRVESAGTSKVGAATLVQQYAPETRAVGSANELRGRP